MEENFKSLALSCWLTKKELIEQAKKLGTHLEKIKESKMYLEQHGIWSEYLAKEMDIDEKSGESLILCVKNERFKLSINPPKEPLSYVKFLNPFIIIKKNKVKNWEEIHDGSKRRRV